MGLEYVVVTIFLMVVGFGLYYIAFKRKAIMWSAFATVLFAVNILYSAGLPFETDVTGATIPTTANVVLSGVNLFFAFFGLIYCVHMAFEFFFKGKA